MVNIVKNTIKDILSKHPVISGFVTGSALLAFSIIHNIDDFIIYGKDFIINGKPHLGDSIDIIWHISFPITFGFLIGYIGISIIEIRKRKKAEAEREKLLYGLSERVKELDCLYSFSKIIEKPNISLEEISHGLADVIPFGWNYPKITCARIVLDGQEYKTGNFKETIWRQSCDIQVFGKKVGSLEVYYLEEKPELYEGPFLKEERNLLNALAKRLGRVIERNETKEALRDAEQKWTSLTKNTNDTIMIVDNNDIMRYVNKTIPPETPEEVIGKTIYEYVSKEHHDVMRKTLKKVYKTREQHSYEITLDMSVINPKIGTLWFNTKVVPIESNKEIHSVIMIATDITERKKAEERIEGERKKFEDIMENMVDGVTLCDKKGKIIYVNKPAIKQLGYTKKEMIGKTPGELFIEKKDLPKFIESVKTIFSGKKIETQEYKARRKNGEQFPASVNVSPQFDSNGKPIALIAVHRDITELKKVAEELQKAKEIAEEANISKSEFLANMSHEIRTPMNGVIGMTELMLDTELTEEQREYLEIVKSSAYSLLNVINDVLDFSKIEAGMIELEHIDFSLRDSISETLKTLGQRAHKKGLELYCDISPEIPDTLIGDPGRLRQIVVNLTGNSIKFTEHGEVGINVNIESESENEAFINFAIRDTGIGIPPEKQKQIFSAFAQADGSTTRKFGGTGLGLSISKQLVELMGGKIRVESEVGKGSTFHFTARFDIQSALTAKKVLVEVENLRELPVLVVDDNTTNRRILEKILLSWGMKPTAVESGKAALEALNRSINTGERYKLILIDALMPDMDGFSLSKHIKDNPEFKKSNIIIMTSSGRPGEAARCRELGIAGYLLKPVSQSELYNTILTTLSAVSLKEKEPSLVTRHSIREGKQRLSILLAEDNPVNKKVATRILEKMGHSVVTAEHGGKALEALGKEHFDLVFMDVQMPEMDGFEATTAIREKEYESGRHIPIIAMTAHAMKGDREKCIKAGMDDYVSKPIKIAELNEVIERVLSVDA